MGMLDYNPYYRCSKCGKRIPESMVPNSITGNVECCGQIMAHPGDPIISYALLAAMGAVLLTWYLTDVGLWVSLAFGVYIFFFVLKVLGYIRDRGRGKEQDADTK